jgi:predicted nucleic acid-binding protein
VSAAGQGRVLIDTCGWIDFLRPGNGVLADQVERALADDLALMCSVSQAELLQGVKGLKEQRQLELLFDNVEVMAVEPADWLSAGRALQVLRGKGFQVPLTDALIAAVAIRHGLPVLTSDTHFRKLGVTLTV